MATADLALDRLILHEVAKGSFQAPRGDEAASIMCDRSVRFRLAPPPSGYGGSGLNSLTIETARSLGQIEHHSRWLSPKSETR